MPGWLGVLGDSVDVEGPMDPHSNSTHVPLAIQRVIEALLIAKSSRERASVLLQGIQATGWASAAGLWRRNNREGHWMLVLSRGPLDALPNGPQIQAVLDGVLDANIPPGKRVAFPSLHGTSGRQAGAASSYSPTSNSNQNFHGDVALGLGQLICGETGMEWVDSLLDLWNSLESASTESKTPLSDSLLEDMTGLLPQSEVDFESAVESALSFLTENFTGDELKGWEDDEDLL